MSEHLKIFERPDLARTPTIWPTIKCISIPFEPCFNFQSRILAAFGDQPEGSRPGGITKLATNKRDHSPEVDERLSKRPMVEHDTVTGWAPFGQPAVHVDEFNRDKKIQILPAYTQDGILHAKIYRGSTDSAVFKEFIEELLPLLGKLPAPKSVVVMDNASFHHSKRIRRMCAAAGVRILFLPPYSPDLNPIEEYFAELKRFIKKQWFKENDHTQPFDTFLRWCVYQVGERRESADGHFRHSGITIRFHNR
ncbi:uncharacterized protein G6M90_00g090430 [Metarhizium brunneum]|uniref:Tc1-like transposase DDE domain-containing protein n=1 Tax=Metarhizium brunneum TaxID=500148 RepID=A0A7D5Z951_9HYPO|nr:hypothetical protein G6M90_00g090430 [Metarhizium brunneum]